MARKTKKEDLPRSYEARFSVTFRYCSLRRQRMKGTTSLKELERTDRLRRKAEAASSPGKKYKEYEKEQNEKLKNIRKSEIDPDVRAQKEKYKKYVREQNAKIKKG